jgi:hypothetical protein
VEAMSDLYFTTGVTVAPENVKGTLGKLLGKNLLMRTVLSDNGVGRKKRKRKRKKKKKKRKKN